MKTNNKFLFTVLAAMAVLACAKEEQPEMKTDAPELSKTLTISASLDGTKAYLEGGKMNWLTTDSLVVYDADRQGVIFKPVSTDKSSANFSTDKWTGKEPCYAVAYCSEYQEKKIIKSTSDGVVTLRLRSGQNNLKWKGCSSNMGSAMIGKVTKGEGDTYSVEQMKNIPGYIGVKLAANNVASIKVSGLNGESVAGWIDVDYKKLVDGNADFWTPTEGQTPVKELSIAPGSGGNALANKCFTAGTYYIAILPQTYSKGLKFTLLDADKKEITSKTVGAESGVTIKRNEAVTVSKYIDDNFPETVVLDLVFQDPAAPTTACNPLGFTGKPAQTNTGETYRFTYNYQNDKAEDASAKLDFLICRTATTTNVYQYSQTTAGLPYSGGYFLNWSAGGIYMKLPVIANRVLSKVVVYLGNGYERDIRIKEVLASSIYLKKTLKSTADGPQATICNFYTDGNDCGNTEYSGNTTKLNTPYYLQFSAAVLIARVELTYTKTLPTR